MTTCATPSTPCSQAPPSDRFGAEESPSRITMIWAAVFPTLTVLSLLLGDWLGDLSPVVRTFVLATIAGPIVIYGLMPQTAQSAHGS
jgi:antibiotic biosynthesis monooxygenase (ABM) superfamily enzyme